MDQYILSCLSQRIKSSLIQLSPILSQKIEEIRIRVERPVELLLGTDSYFLTEKGDVTSHFEQALIASLDDGQKILNLISRHSLYAFEEELRRGYITIFGGHRVGIAGRAVVEDGHVKVLKDIKSFNFRIAREVKEIAKPLLKHLTYRKRFLNTLIISPPQCGKTTLIRDLIRSLSYGIEPRLLPRQKVGLVDERSEIASCVDGVPQKDLGPCVDVLDACPKADGMMMLIRSMSPDIIACDEIGSFRDSEAVIEAMHAGVSMLTTAHGFSMEDVKQRPGLKSLFESPVFQRYIILSKRLGAGTIEAILDEQGRSLAIERHGGATHA